MGSVRVIAGKSANKIRFIAVYPAMKSVPESEGYRTTLGAGSGVHLWGGIYANMSETVRVGPRINIFDMWDLIWGCKE